MVVFCDVGQGDGVLIIKNDFQMIIDAGREDGRMRECVSKYMPFWDKEIEVAIISHWDGDHSGGLAKLMEVYRIDSVYSGIAPPEGFEQINYSGNLDEADVLRYENINFEVELPKENMKWLGTDSNEMSVVGFLKYGTYNFMFTGDTTGDEERYLVWRGLLDKSGDRRILKVSHHGSASATSEELIKAWEPTEAVVSVGKNNYGHPNAEVMERLEKMGAKILRTDVLGDVVYQIKN